MKTKELIQRLQEEDPTGELEVVVDSHPIILVEKLPAYYDGRMQKFEGSFPNLTKAKYVSTGDKVKIMTYSIEDAIWDNPSIEVDSDGCKYLEEFVEKVRKEAIKFEEELARESQQRKIENR